NPVAESCACIVARQDSPEKTNSEPDTDKLPYGAVQINFQKSKKNLSPLEMLIMPNLNLAKTMEKLTERNRRTKIEFVRLAFVASVGFSLCFVANAFAQNPPAAPAPAQPTAAEATAERVIVTGSNIPTAEETGPNPVDTYRVEDIQKMGVRSTQDLTTFLPQESGFTTNQNIGNGGDGTIQLNLR